MPPRRSSVRSLFTLGCWERLLILYAVIAPLRFSLSPLHFVDFLFFLILVAKFFGLPTATAENVVLFPSATGRNLGAGIFVWALTLLGERRALGIFLLCWTWAGIADTKILCEHPHGQSQGMHIRNILILLVLGPLLIRSATPL